MSVRVKELNSLTLAYIGDAIYELYIRKHLIYNGKVKPHQLHTEAVTFVSAKSQANVIRSWIDASMLTEEEAVIVRRGRNAKSNSIPKNASIRDYRYATAFEALLGYHYLLHNEERLEFLILDAISINLQLLKKEEGI